MGGPLGDERRLRPFGRRLVAELPGLRRFAAASVVLGLVSTGTVVAQALALGRLLAGVMPSAAGAAAGDRVAALCWLGGAAGVRGLCQLAGDVLGRYTAADAKARLRGRLVLASVATASAGGATKGPAKGPGDIATLAGKGLDALDVYIARLLPALVLALLAPLALALSIGLLDWLSGLVVVVAIALFPVFGALVGRSAMGLARARWAQLEALGRQVTDVFAGLPVLKAFGLSRTQRARLEVAGEALCQASLATLRTAFLSALVLDTLASVSVALVAVPLGLRLLSGSIALSTALAVLIIAPEAFVPLRRASAEFHASTEGLAAAHEAMAVIDGVGAGSDRAGQPAPDPALAPVALRAVRAEVPGRAEPVLEGATLQIDPGETVVLVGRNGLGKSTVLSLLLGFAEPARGAVTVGAADLRQLDLADWRRRVAYLPERPAIVSATLAENLRLAFSEATDEQLVTALEAAGAGALLSGLPDGLESRLGEQGIPLSAGERQRIALARVLLRPASLYLLDEPTAHLDRGAEAAVVAGLAARLAGRSAVVVTHRPAVLGLADRVVTIHDGTFVEVPAPAGPLMAPAGELVPA